MERFLLSGPLYSTVYEKVRLARSTGDATKLALIQQRVCMPTTTVCSPIYHVGLLGESGNRRRIFEHGPVKYNPLREINGDTIIIDLPAVKQTLDELEAIERTLPSIYFVGIRDCRHHVLDLLAIIYGV